MRSGFGCPWVSWPEVADDAESRIADAPLDVGLVHELRTYEQFASFGERCADGMVGSEAFGSAAFMKEVWNGTIQVTFDQIKVPLVAGFVHRERKADWAWAA